MLQVGYGSLSIHNSRWVRAEYGRCVFSDEWSSVVFGVRPEIHRTRDANNPNSLRSEYGTLRRIRIMADPIPFPDYWSRSNAPLSSSLYQYNSIRQTTPLWCMPLVAVYGRVFILKDMNATENEVPYRLIHSLSGEVGGPWSLWYWVYWRAFLGVSAAVQWKSIKRSQIG